MNKDVSEAAKGIVRTSDGVSVPAFLGAVLSGETNCNTIEE